MNSFRLPLWLRLALPLALTSAVACAGGGAAFSTRYPDNRSDDVQDLVENLGRAPRRTRAGIAIGVSASPVGLYAFDVNTQRTLWQQAAPLSGTPIIAGNQVVVQDGDRVVGRDLRTGRLTFSINAGEMKLIGADGEGNAAVLALSKGQGTFARSRIVLMEGQSVGWDIPLDYQAGAPALFGETVIVPWGNQYLSGLTRASGEEVARIRISDGVFAQAFVDGGSVYAGSEEGVARVDQALAGGRMQQGAYLPAPEGELPGRPAFVPNVYRRDEILGPTSARHSIALTWTPQEKGTGALSVTDGVVYLVFYRFVFALTYPSLELRWVQTHDADLVGAQAARGGVLVVDAKGKFSLLSSTSGSVHPMGGTDRATTAAVLPEGMVFPLSATEEVDEDMVRKQLVLASQDPDTRLVPVRRLAVQLLSGLPSEAATRDLLALCEGERSAPAVRQEACDALAGRTTGTADLMATLDRHYDYIAQQPAPPVEALARAAAQQGKKSAMPALVAHLNDPHTPAPTLHVIIKALFELDEKAAVAPVSEFVKLYHADGLDEYLVRALVEAIKGLATTGTEPALATLHVLAEDPLGLRTVREKANAMLAEHDKSSRMEAQQVADAAKQAEAGDEIDKAPKVEVDAGPPGRLTPALVQQTLLPVRRKLSACLTQNGRNDFRARVILVVEDDKLQLVSVLPSELQACVEPLIRTQEFPKTLNAARQQVTHTITRN